MTKSTQLGLVTLAAALFGALGALLATHTPLLKLKVQDVPYTCTSTSTFLTHGLESEELASWGFASQTSMLALWRGQMNHPVRNGNETDCETQKPSFMLDVDCNRSTENYHRSDQEKNYGTYASIRSHVDYDYHAYYSRSRQLFQDSIIDSMLESTSIEDEYGQQCSQPTRPWIVFSAGVMGAGKTHVVKELDRSGFFPLQSFVSVDPDQIRHNFLPEFDFYVQQCPELAGERTRKETGMIAEILIQAALQKGQNVLVDGTLRDADWHRQYFRDLRVQYPNIRIAILHIVAPREIVFQRAESRAKITGRVVPRDLLERTMSQVPKSISALEKTVDFVAELHNLETDEVELVTENLDWSRFRNTWIQTCSTLNA